MSASSVISIKPFVTTWTKTMNIQLDLWLVNFNSSFIEQRITDIKAIQHTVRFERVKNTDHDWTMQQRTIAFHTAA